MRTITTSLKKRLVAQAEEAKFQGLEKTASQLNVQAQEVSVRGDFEDYVYSKQDLINDVEKLLWSAAIRTQDYFGKTADAHDIEQVIEACAEDLITTIKTKIGGEIVGPYEPIVPGEERFIVEID